MLKTHLLALVLFFSSILVLTLILYALYCIFFSVGVEDEQQIERLYAYECSFGSFSDARDAFDIKFYLVVVLFLIFDLEISFMLSMSVTLSTLSLNDLIIVIFFLLIW